MLLFVRVFPNSPYTYVNVLFYWKKMSPSLCKGSGPRHNPAKMQHIPVQKFQTFENVISVTLSFFISKRVLY